jgi:hypothetical protein
MIKDLVNKIVPTKIIVRELHTTSGKVLNRDSHYALIERKRRVQKGKKWEYEYFYELEVRKVKILLIVDCRLWI